LRHNWFGNCGRSSSNARCASLSVEILMKAESTQRYDRAAVDQQCSHLRPERVCSGALKEDSAHDLHEVAQRIQIREILHEYRHILDGKCKAAEHECGNGKEEYR